MFDRIMLFLGGACGSAAIALQGVNLPEGAHAFGIKLAGIICTAVAAGCLSLSPSVRGATKDKTG